MFPPCQSSAQPPFCFSLPSLGNRAPDIFPNVLHMKASSSSLLSVLSSAGASHARTETTLAQISAACPLPLQTPHSCPGHRTALWPTLPQRLHFTMSSFRPSLLSPSLPCFRPTRPDPYLSLAPFLVCVHETPTDICRQKSRSPRQ